MPALLLFSVRLMEEEAFYMRVIPISHNTAELLFVLVLHCVHISAPLES